jgi:hypothetical protein
MALGEIFSLFLVKDEFFKRPKKKSTPGLQHI